MKNQKLLLLIFFLLSFGNINGQENTYKIWKDYYKPSDFSRLNEKPVYSPARAGLSNLLYSGVGHFYLDEPELGRKFARAELVTECIAVVSTVTFAYTLIAAGSFYADDPITGLLMIGSGLYLGAAPVLITTIRIISTASAVKIAKIKSVAYRTSTTKPVSWNLLPDIKYDHFGMNTHSMVGGLSLTVTF